MSTTEDLDALRALADSRGWEILHEVIERNIAQQATRLADPALAYDNSVHFMRGALWATQRMRDLPDIAITDLTNTLALSTIDPTGDT